MKIRHLMLATGAFLLAVPAYAQDGAAKVATCNTFKVIEQMNARKAFDADFLRRKASINAEGTRRQNDVTALRKERDDLNPASALYKEKNQQLVKLVIELRVFQEVQLAELDRFEKESWRDMYNRIRDAAQEVAKAKGIDLVLSERHSDLPNIEALNPDQVKAVILQNDVLYAGPKVDITNDVLITVDKKYVAQPK